MEKHIGSEDLLKFMPIGDVGSLHTKKWRRRRYWPFRWGLAVSEALMAFIALWICARTFGLPFGNEVGAIEFIMLGILSLIMLSFSPTYHLYNYHVIFSRKRHQSAFLKSIGWSFVVIAILLAQFILPKLAVKYPLFTASILIAGGICLFGLGYHFRDAMPLLMRAFGLGFIAMWLLDFVYLGHIVFDYSSVWTVPLFWGFSAASVWCVRSFVVGTLYNNWLRRFYRRQVGIIGTNEDAAKIASHIIDNNAPFWVAGTIGCGSCLQASIPKDCLGEVVEFPAIARRKRLNDIIVTDENLDRRTLISLLDMCLTKGINVWFTPELMPIIDRKLYIDHFCGIPMIRMCSQKRVVWFNRMKYALDAFITLPACIVLFPFFGLLALAIKIDSRGPVFYCARAIGKNGQEFKMFKFRSMHVNNDATIHKEFVTKLIKGEIGTNEETKEPLKITNDPRITRVGNILRKTSLDELPQLLNVLMGQMSLIGPRPCLPYEFDVYQDWYKKRAAIRPGITGLWQVAGRSEVAFEEMILLDLYYLYNRSLWMDINLLIETVFVVLKKKGAY